MDQLGLSFVVIGILGAATAVGVQRLIGKTTRRTSGPHAGKIFGGLRVMLPMFVMSLVLIVAGIVLILT